MLNTQLNSESNDMLITSHLGSDSLPKVVQNCLNVATSPSGSLMQKQFLDSLPTEFSKSDAEHLANTLGVSVDTMKRWLTNYVQSGVLQRITQGCYRKEMHQVA